MILAATVPLPTPDLFPPARRTAFRSPTARRAIDLRRIFAYPSHRRNSERFQFFSSSLNVLLICLSLATHLILTFGGHTSHALASFGRYETCPSRPNGQYPAAPNLRPEQT